MQPVKLFPGYRHRLLVAAARAHHAGEEPCDWHELAHAAGLDISAPNVNQSLARLADAGLVEGVYTPSGWLSVRATARGLRQAGREGHQVPDGPLLPSRSLAVVEVTAQSETDEESTAVRPNRRPLPRTSLAVASRGGALAARHTGAALRRGQERAGEVLTPRVTAVRTSVIQAWHVFTTFP